MAIDVTLQVKRNGGAPATGGITATAGDVIQLTAASKSGWPGNSVRWELFQYPVGYALPAGWTQDTDDATMPSYYVLGVSDPPTFTASASGPYKTRLVVANQPDERTFIKVNYASGLKPTARGEGGQFGGTKLQAVGPIEDNWKTLDGKTGVSGACTPEMFGAVGDNSTDDQAAFASAFAAILAGTYRVLLIGAKSYFVGSGGLLVPPTNCAVIGQGPGATIIRTTANNDIFRVRNGSGLVDGVRITGIRFQGNSTGTSQIGIEVGYTGSDGGDNVFIDNCIAENMGGRGFSIAYGTGNSPGPSVNDCHAINCAVEGFGAYTQMQFTGCTARACGIGLHVGGGNVIFDGGDLSVNTIGIKIDGGGNSAHGIVSATEINHCVTYSVQVADNVANGHSFVGCHIYDSGMSFGGNTGGSAGLIDFRSCVIDPASLTFVATSNVRFTDCSFPGGYANTDNGLGDVDFVNARAVVGDMPAWVGARSYLRYTFPGDADQSLSNTKSRARVIDVQAGVITATRTLTATRAPKLGERIRVVNRTAQTVNFAWATGAGIAIPTLNAADVAADGTNAICEMIASNVAAASGIVDPTTLSLTGFYRGTWAVPWPGTASAGTSGAHSLVTDAHDPVAGLTLNAHQAADFAGTHYLKDITETADLYLSTTAYRIHMLVYVTGTSAPAGSVFNDPCLVSESGGNWGIAIDNTGVHVFHSSATVASSSGALSTGAWHDVDVLYNGTNVTVTVDGVAGTPGASGGTGSLTGAAFFLCTNFNKSADANVQVMDLIVAPTSLASTTAAQFKAYVNNRYGLSL